MVYFSEIFVIMEIFMYLYLEEVCFGGKDFTYAQEWINPTHSIMSGDG